MRLATIIPENGATALAAVSVDVDRFVGLHAFLSFFRVERTSREFGRADGAVPSHSHAAFIRVYAQAERLAGTRKGLPEARRQKFSRAKAFAAGYASLNVPRFLCIRAAREGGAVPARSRHGRGLV